jgi:hypothetical protein
MSKIPNKNILALFFPLGLFISLLLWYAISNALMSNVEIRIKGYDPRDILVGHYIAYDIDWEQTDCTQFIHGICPKAEFLKTAVLGIWGGYFRFYVSERAAPKLEKVLQNEQNTISLIYKYRRNYTPRAVQLLVNGQPLAM